MSSSKKPSIGPVKAMFDSLRVGSIPPSSRLPREAKEARNREQRKVEIKPKDRNQTYLLIQSIQRSNPASANRIKMEIAKEIISEAAKGENPVYLTLSAAMDIVEHEYQKAIGFGREVPLDLTYAKERFKAANKILFPEMSKGFYVHKPEKEDDK